MTDDPSPSADDFDRIVEGLDLDVTGLEDFDDSAARVAAAREQAELAELAERQRESEEPPDDQFYREVGPADLHADNRTKIAWGVIIAGPALLVLSTIASINLPMAAIVTVIAASVGAVVYLIARLPDRGPSNPEWPDDGASL